MATGEFSDMNEDDLRRSFLILGCKFFQLNSNPASSRIPIVSPARLALFETNYAERFKPPIARSAKERVLDAFESAPKSKQPAGWINESVILAFSSTNHK